MYKGLIFSLIFAGILAILVTLTYHWFFTSPSTLLLLLAFCSASITTNMAWLFHLIKKEV